MGKVDGTMFIVEICKEFGWTYAEYCDQPSWFIDLIREKMVCDNKEREFALKSSKKRGY